MAQSSPTRVTRILAATAIAASVFFAAEIALRAIQLVSSGVSPTTLLPGARDTRFPMSPFLVFGPRLDYQIEGRINPELARFNSDGVRFPGSTPPRRQEEIRILALGGSTTENIWNEAGIHWPLVAQCRLQEAGYNVRILNSAMSAYSTAHSLVRLSFDVIDKLDPDIIVLMHAVNDLGVVYWAAATGNQVDPHYLVKYGQRDYTLDLGPDDVVLLRTLNTLRRRLLSSDRALIPDKDRIYRLDEGVEIFSQNIELISEIIRVRDRRLVLLTMPFSENAEFMEIIRATADHQGAGMRLFPEFTLFRQHMNTYNEAVRQVGDRLGVSMIDMAKLYTESDGDFVDPVHYSTHGVLRFGDVLARELEAAIELPRGLDGVEEICTPVLELSHAWSAGSREAASLDSQIRPGWLR